MNRREFFLSTFLAPFLVIIGCGKTRNSPQTYIIDEDDSRGIYVSSLIGGDFPLDINHLRGSRKFPFATVNYAISQCEQFLEVVPCAIIVMAGHEEYVGPGEEYEGWSAVKPYIE